MTQKQHPLGIRFHRGIDDRGVIAGIDLTGRNVVVTGGHIGLGLETTRALSRAGASVTVASATRTAPLRTGGYRARRDQPAGPPRPERRSTRSSPGIATRGGRCTSWSTTRASWAGRCSAMPAATKRSSRPTTSATSNCTLGLLPALQAAAGARVVEVSSWGHHLSDIRWDDPHFETRLRRHGRVRPGEDRQRAVRRRAGPAVGRRRHPRAIRSTRARSSAPAWPHGWASPNCARWASSTTPVSRSSTRTAT